MCAAVCVELYAVWQVPPLPRSRKRASLLDPSSSSSIGQASRAACASPRDATAAWSSGVLCAAACVVLCAVWHVIHCHSHANARVRAI